MFLFVARSLLIVVGLMPILERSRVSYLAEDYFNGDKSFDNELEFDRISRLLSFLLSFSMPRFQNLRLALFEFVFESKNPS